MLDSYTIPSYRLAPVASTAGTAPGFHPDFRPGFYPGPRPNRSNDRRSGRNALPGGRAARALDIIVALAALLVFAPVMLVAAAAILLTNSGPVLFRQRRIGFNGEFFTVIKLRTMHVDADAMLDALLAADPAARAEWHRNHKLQDDPRIIGIGNFLRRTSLDELPQLFNVLAGDMAVVGPRPIIPAEITRYGRHFGAYCAVQPGITGLWQVSGRSDTSFRRRVACDRLYARRKSPLVDLRIMMCTVPVVLIGRGAC